MLYNWSFFTRITAYLSMAGSWLQTRAGLWNHIRSMLPKHISPFTCLLTQRGPGKSTSGHQYCLDTASKATECRQWWMGWPSWWALRCWRVRGLAQHDFWGWWLGVPWLKKGEGWIYNISFRVLEVSIIFFNEKACSKWSSMIKTRMFLVTIILLK